MHHVLAWLPVWHQFTWLWGGESQGAGAGTGYLITSGPLGDLFIIGGAIALYRKHNCHRHGCWRMSWHPDPKTGHPLCKKHHPHDPKTLRAPMRDGGDRIGETTTEGW